MQGSRLFETTALLLRPFRAVGALRQVDRHSVVRVYLYSDVKFRLAPDLVLRSVGLARALVERRKGPAGGWMCLRAMTRTIVQVSEQDLYTAGKIATDAAQKA